MMEKSLIEDFDYNFAQIKERIATAAVKSGRKPEDITLLAAVKTVSCELINYAISQGIEYIGDNRVQEMISKEKDITQNVHKHFIGHLQSNKVKDVIDRVEMIESVDTVKLAEVINKQALSKDKCIDILLEVNIGGEESKSGFSANELENSVRNIAMLPGVHICGLMCIPPICSTEEGNKEFFIKMRKLFIDIRDKNIDNVNMDVLSMGMSDTYETAIECGSTLVRVGTLLFGKRNYN